MRPFLFSIGTHRIPSFFFMIMVGTLTATWYGYWLGVRHGLNRKALLDLGTFLMPTTLIGARIFHILVEAPDYYWAHPIRVFEFWRGGFVSWGGFISTLAVFVWYLHWKKLPVWSYLDLVSAGVPIFKFFVRVGCLLVGCCYGFPTNLPWGMRFTNPESTAYYYMGDVPLHPTQIYSMIHAALLFVIVNWVYQRSKFPGQTFCVLLIFWTIGRAIVEYYRADIDRGMFFGGLLSTGQIMSGIILVGSVTLYFILSKRHAAA